MTMIHVQRLNYDHSCAIRLSFHNVFGKNASDKSCKISKKLFTDIRFDLG